MMISGLTWSVMRNLICFAELQQSFAHDRGRYRESDLIPVAVRTRQPSLTYGRQHDAKGGTDPFPAFHLNMAFVCRDDFVCQRQTDAPVARHRL